MSGEYIVSKAQAKKLFSHDCKFVLGAEKLDQIPSNHFPEIAFIGRSNVGKSSLINALTGQRGLARTSVTPGRTQQLNFFLLGDRLMMVDLPGYGFAKAPKKMVDRWNRLIRMYLSGRANLRRVCLLIDSRRGVMKIDHELMSLLDDAAVPFQLVLTKSDKIPKNAQDKLLQVTREALATHPASHPEILLTSAETNDGIDALRIEIAAFLAQ